MLLQKLTLVIQRCDSTSALRKHLPCIYSRGFAYIKIIYLIVCIANMVHKKYIAHRYSHLNSIID